MNKHLIPRLSADELNHWQPGWRTGIAHNIAHTSDIPPRKKRSNGPVWTACLVVLAMVGVVVAWL